MDYKEKCRLEMEINRVCATALATWISNRPESERFNAYIMAYDFVDSICKHSDHLNFICALDPRAKE